MEPRVAQRMPNDRTGDGQRELCLAGTSASLTGDVG
jgi:hypothetical protein